MSTATDRTFLNQTDPGCEGEPRGRRALLGILILWALLFGLRLLGPDDLMDKDQENPAAYVQDAVLNGRWIVQWGYDDRISSKPPLYTWMAALTTLALGRISSFSLYLVPGLATLATVLLVWRFGCRHWGQRGGLVSALIYLVSAVAAKQMALARTDGVFTFFVTLTALCAYEVWTTRRGAPGFWFAAALATLTKGPLGLALGAGGLLAALWRSPGQKLAAYRDHENTRQTPTSLARSKDSEAGYCSDLSTSSGSSAGPAADHVDSSSTSDLRPKSGLGDWADRREKVLISGESVRDRGLLTSAPATKTMFQTRSKAAGLWIHGVGLAFYLAIAGGWFWAAYVETGEALTEKMIHTELLSHATGENTGKIPGSLFYRPPLQFLGRFAPWSLIVLIGLWRVVKRPSAEPTTRRFERFLFCWFTAGIALFALGVHHRGDLLFPLVPAAALLAGRELAGWMRSLTANRFRACLLGGTAIGVTLIAVKYFWLRPMDPYVRQTQEVRTLAAQLTGQVGLEFPFTYVDAPYGLQIYLNTLHRAVSPERAAQLLRGEPAAFVVVSEATDLPRRTNETAKIHTLMHWRLTARPALRVLGNRPELKAAQDMAACVGPLHVRMIGVRPVQLADRRLVFAPPEGNGWVEITNQSERIREVEVRWTPDTSWRRHRLNPGEMWRLPGPVRPPASARLVIDP